MLLPIVTHWSELINLIIQTYFLDSSAICILWPQYIDLQLYTKSTENYQQFINIYRNNLAQSFQQNVYNYSSKELSLNERGLQYDDMVKQLIVAIEYSHCESFLAFQEDIPIFASAFHKASIYSIWRSLRYKFLFAYSKDQQDMPYFEDLLFIDQPRILIIEAESLNSSIFELKTNKFVGSVRAHPEQLYLLDRYNANNGSFAFARDLYPDKIINLQGREVTICAFDYRPFVVLDYTKQPQVYDFAADNLNHSILVDGIEVRVLLAFCEMYNCTIQADTSEKGDWGYIYDNATGSGLAKMLLEGQSQMAMGALYSWDSWYTYLDMTAFLGRSGITCLVPAPTRLTSWNLPLKPFQFTLWLGVSACLLLEVLSLLVTRRLQHTEQGRTPNTWLHSFQFGYITTMKLFISQGSDYVVQSTSVRTVLFSCYMIDIIITSIYGGGLASILTLPILGESADSLERLHKFGLPWTATSIAWVEAIKEVKDPVIVDVYNRFKVYSFDEMRELAKTEQMGFVVERLAFGHFGNVDYVTTQALDRLKLMLDDIYFQYTVAFVPRIWAMLQKYNNFIYAWHSSGFDKFWEWKVAAEYMNEHDQEQIQASKFANPDGGPVQLDMANFAGLIVIWFVGMGISILVFSLELCYYKYRTLAGAAKQLEN